MPKLQIDEDLKQLNINFNIKTELEYDTKSILKTIQERVKTKMVFKLRG